MAKKIKLEMTEAQFVAMIELVDGMSAMVGSAGADDFDKETNHYIGLFDRMLKKNGYERIKN